MEKEKFYNLAQNPSKLNRDSLEGLKKLTEDFPNFHAAWMLYLKNLKDLNDPEFDEVLKKAAPLLPDRKQLYRFLHSKNESSGFRPDMNTPGIQVMEYTLEKPDASLSGDNLIDKFLSTAHSPRKLNIPLTDSQSLATENEIIAKSLTEDDELVTETLANIYAVQKKYDKALEAFKKLSLKYPEKNSYFATRIEEIEKLKNI